MTFYVIQDSDWDWDDHGFIVKADSPEQAAEKIGPTLDADGCHFKVAEINLIGFISWDKETGVEPFQPLMSRPGLNMAGL